MTLSPHFRRLNRIQKEAVERASKLLNREGRCLIVMTTGTGKTMVGSKIIRRHHDHKVLWLTQMEELIEQTRRDLESIFGPNEVGLFKRGKKSTEERIIVASLQTIEKKENLESIPKNAFDLIVVDEAHHAPASTWEKVIQYFKGKRLGLTATPIRHDGKGLEEIFGDTAFELSYEEAKKLRLISEEVYRVILTNSKIEGIVTRSGEYQPHELDRLVVSQDRNEIIVDSYKRLGRAFMKEHGLPTKAICFCITVDHAVRMRDLFRKHGIQSDVIVSKHSLYSSQEDRTNPLTEKERREVYASFLDGSGPEILCVVNVLNEGKNIPDVGCLLMARPTRSAIIYQQQMGRGCRRIEGKKETYLVLDYVDLMNQKYPPMSLTKVLGRRPKPHEIIVDYYRGSDPLVVDEYVQYLSPSYRFHEEPRWTKPKIEKALHSYYRKHKKITHQDLITSKTGLPNRATLKSYWGSVAKCFQELGIPYKEASKRWTKESVEAAIRDWLALHGKIDVTDLGSKHNMPSQKTVYQFWGTWRNCEKALKIDKWNDATIAEAIKRFIQVHRRNPKIRELTSSYGLPHLQAVKKVFGSLSKAIEAA